MLDTLLQHVPAPRHREYLGLLGHIPPYAKRIAVVGRSSAAIGALLKRRGETTVIGVTGDAKGAALASKVVDDVIQRPEDVVRCAELPIQALVLCNLESELEEAFRWVPCLAPQMDSQAHIYALHGNPDLPDATNGSAMSALESRLAEALATNGFHVYLRHPVADAGTMHIAIPSNYNPLVHAQDLMETGEPSYAFQVLETIPGVYLEDIEARQNVWLASLAALTKCLETGKGGEVSSILGRAQDLFYSLADEFPRLGDACQLMARCWELAGNPWMARRLLATMHHAVPTQELRQQLETIPAETAQTTLSAQAPLWVGTRPFRVLFIMNPRLHFGLDGLYDGLCACLGDENVVEFPYKPTLHGQDADTYKNYACRYTRGGSPVALADLVAELQAGAFDAILYGDVEGDVPLQDIRTLLDVRGECPVYLVDALDQLTNFRSLVSQRLQLPAFAAYFKREMVGSVDYGPNSFPLPFSYAVPKTTPTPFAQRAESFFWAGHRRFGQRRILLETLEDRYGWNLQTEYSQEEYQARLNNTRIGLNCFGMGFDTVRYWELPAHGCLMISERLPIRIPSNFEDGVHAIFFDDLPALLERLEHYLHHPEEAADIAAAGYRHFLEHHTNEARARQALGWIEAAQSIQAPR